MRAQFARSFRALSGRYRSSNNQAVVQQAITAAVKPVHPKMETLEERRLLSTYYVSSYGSDSKSGLSQSSAWKSINRVNAQKLKAGDKVLFQGGKSFSGSLYVPSSEAGTGSSAVVFSSYGSGRATINSGSKPGIDVAQAGGVAISNLVFNGGGMSYNKTAGIYFHIDWSNRDKSNVHIRNVEVKNYGKEGIKFQINGRGGSSLSNVKIEDTSVHDNKYGGIKSTSMKHNNNKNWVIQRVKAYNNPGSRSTSDVTGSGIFIADVDGATIQHSVAYNNGKDGNRPVGIWVAGSNRVTMQYNEAYNNRTRSQSDGGGFDFDWDTHNSVMQYNYSHSNDGPGFLIYAGSHAAGGNVIRYNVSQNDGRKNGKAGIQLGGNVYNTKVYNNTVYIAGTGHYHSSAFQAHDFGSNGKVPKSVEVRNNIFYATNGAKVVWTSGGVASKGDLKFYGNAYYSPSSFKIQWGSSGYTSLSSWRNAKGKEKLNGVATGYQGNPKLNSAGQGGTLGSWYKMSTLSAYRLRSDSPLINKGVSHPSTLSAVVTKDFYGGSAKLGGKHDIGVDEVR